MRAPRELGSHPALTAVGEDQIEDVPYPPLRAQVRGELRKAALQPSARIPARLQPALERRVTLATNAQQHVSTNAARETAGRGAMAGPFQFQPPAVADADLLTFAYKTPDVDTFTGFPSQPTFIPTFPVSDPLLPVDADPTGVAISLRARFLENYAYGFSKKHNAAIFLVQARTRAYTLADSRAGGPAPWLRHAQGGESPHRVTLELSLSSSPSFTVRVVVRLAYADSDQTVAPETVSGVAVAPLTDWESGAPPSVVFDPTSNLVKRIILKFNRLSRKNLFAILIESECGTFSCRLGPLMSGSRFDQSLDTFSDIYDGMLQGAKGREEGKASRRIREAREARVAGMARAQQQPVIGAIGESSSKERERKVKMLPAVKSELLSAESIDVSALRDLQILSPDASAESTFSAFPDDNDALEPLEPVDPAIKLIVEKAHLAYLEAKLLSALQEANATLQPAQWMPFANALAGVLRKPNLKRIALITPVVLGYWDRWRQVLASTGGSELSADAVAGILIELFQPTRVTLEDLDLLAGIALGESNRPNEGWLSKRFSLEECMKLCFWSCPAALCLRAAQSLVDKSDPQWFYPFLSSDAAQRRLMGSGSGCFLLRLSSQAYPDEGAGLVTASFVKNDGVYHQRIPVSSSNLFATAEEILEYVKSHPNRFERVWMSPEELASKRVRGTEGKYFDDG